MSQSKLLSYFGKKRKEKELVEESDANLSSNSDMNTPTDTINPSELHTSKKQNQSGETTFFMNKKEPCQPLLNNYPKRQFGNRQRSFNADWYDKYKWLEYSEELDSCFCFPCRVFLTSAKENTFTKTGFNNWKNALDSGKGF